MNINSVNLKCRECGKEAKWIAIDLRYGLDLKQVAAAVTKGVIAPPIDEYLLPLCEEHYKEVKEIKPSMRMDGYFI